MKQVVNYVLSTMFIFIGILLLLCGGWLAVCGLLYFIMLYLSSPLFPRWWDMFLSTNRKIMNCFYE